MGLKLIKLRIVIMTSVMVSGGIPSNDILRILTKLLFYIPCIICVKAYTCSSLSSPKEIPPDMRTVAVSGTLNTFHPRLSKNVARWAWPVVLPPQGPPVKTSLWIRRVGGMGSLTSKSFILYFFFSQLDTMNQNYVFRMSLLKICSVSGGGFLLRLFLSWIEINEVSLSIVSLHEASGLLNLIAQPYWKDFGLLSKKGPFVEFDLISQSVFGIIWKVILHYFQSVLALALTPLRKNCLVLCCLRWFSFLASQVAVLPITLMYVEVSFAGAVPLWAHLSSDWLVTQASLHVLLSCPGYARTRQSASTVASNCSVIL